MLSKYEKDPGNFQFQFNPTEDELKTLKRLFPLWHPHKDWVSWEGLPMGFRKDFCVWYGFPEDGSWVKDLPKVTFDQALLIMSGWKEDD